MDFDEPEPMPFSARHWLGATLLEAERYAEAAKVFEDELDDHPRNGWSYYGLREALKAQAKSTAELDKKFEESWRRSEVMIESSRF